MATRGTLDKDARRAIRDARAVIQQAEKADVNEAETRRRIERIFENVMGYDPFKHLSRERAIRGAGETEHVDFAINVGEGDDARPIVMVEIKRVAVDLAKKHLKQIASYAIDAGCEWALLTNGREWKLYHVSFGQPPETREVRQWNLLTDDIADIAEGFELISFKSVRRGALDDVWQKTSVLLPRNLLEAIVCEDSLNSIRRQLRKKSGVLLPPEDVLKGLRRLLNESALTELEDVRISLPKRTPRKAATGKKGEVGPAGSPGEDSGETESEEIEEETTAPDSVGNDW